MIITVGKILFEIFIIIFMTALASIPILICLSIIFACIVGVFLMIAELIGSFFYEILKVFKK